MSELKFNVSKINYEEVRPMNMDETEVSGELVNTIWNENNFLVGILDNDKKVVGNATGAKIGLTYWFRGSWVRNKRGSGYQFSFKEYGLVIPTDEDSIFKYILAVCKGRGVGPSITGRLIAAYGKETIEICKHDPGRVSSEVNGVSLKLAQLISSALRNSEETEGLMLELNKILADTKITKRSINDIIKTWGVEAPRIIAENPYRMIEEIYGVGFKTADEVAIANGYDVLGTPRIKSGVVHVLKENASRDGHTRVPGEGLIAEAMVVLNIGRGPVESVIDTMVKAGILVTKSGFCYLRSFYDQEVEIANKISILSSASVYQPDISDEMLTGWGLAEDQIEAVKKISKYPLCILTGAPGVGKTYTIKCIMKLFPGAHIELAAPTGKAAKRILEQSGHKAQTIHKLLEPQMVDGKFVFSKKEDNQIVADIIVLDEMSMVDTALFCSFLRAVRPKTRLILVGDTNQLPSVGPGNVLKDLIDSEVIPSAELTIIKRQDEGLIVNNCHKIKDGLPPEINNSSKDFFFLDCETEKKIKTKIVDLVNRRLPETYGVDKLKDIQIITPQNEKTDLGCKKLNEKLQMEINKSPTQHGSKFKVGDKVIQTKNRYDLEIINGDIGYIIKIDEKDKLIVVDFENPKRTVELNMHLNELRLAYAITCHKFQGSEAPIIIIPVHNCFAKILFQRNWVYTAISRAKTVCILIGQREQLFMAVKRNNQQKRYTGLREMLCQEKNS